MATLDPVFAEMLVLAGRNIWGVEHLTAREKTLPCLTADLCRHHVGAPLAMPNHDPHSNLTHDSAG